MNLGDIEEKAKTLLARHEVIVPLLMEKEEVGTRSFGAYHFQKNAIILREIPLREEYCEQRRQGIFNSMDDFLDVILCHEVGHALDEELPRLQIEKTRLLQCIKEAKTEQELDRYIGRITNVVLEAEHNAWRYAKMHVAKGCVGSLEIYQRVAIEKYVNSFLYLRERVKSLLVS